MKKLNTPAQMRFLTALIGLFFALSSFSQTTGDTVVVEKMIWARKNINNKQSGFQLEKHAAFFINNELMQDDLKWYEVTLIHSNEIVYVAHVMIESQLKQMETENQIMKAKRNAIRSQEIGVEKRYGKPDNVSNYSSGDYRSKTYVYHCASGRYRNITFVRKYDSEFRIFYWVIESEYDSECID